MALVCIDGCLLGEDFDVLYDSEKGTYKKALVRPAGCWTLGDPESEYSLELLAKLSCKQAVTRPDDRFTKPYQLINSGSQGVRWRYALPQPIFNGFLSQMLESIRIILGSGYVTYYTEVFRRIRGCLGALKPIRVDQARLESYHDNEPNESNRSALASFKPGPDGFAAKLTLSQVSTVTGRLTVEQGPRLLTLPKRYRDIIVSRYDGGKVFSLDFTSLEPRVILLELGRTPPADVYAHICDGVLDGTLTRMQAKVITISLLYGASRTTIEKVSGIHGIDLDRAISSINSYFGIDELVERLLKSIGNDNVMLNHYGRPVMVSDKRKVLSLFTQSSAIDAAMLGFSGTIEMVENEGWMIAPLGPIHDAMLFDVHPSYVGYLEKIRSKTEQIPGYGDVSLPVRIEELTCLTTQS